MLFWAHPLQTFYLFSHHRWPLKEEGKILIFSQTEYAKQYQLDSGKHHYRLKAIKRQDIICLAGKNGKSGDILLDKLYFCGFYSGGGQYDLCDFAMAKNHLPTKRKANQKSLG